MGKRDLSATLHRRSAQASNTEAACYGDDAADRAYEALFGNVQPAVGSNRFAELPIAQLHSFHTANIGFKPYGEDDLRALADDIAANGVLERIKVRPEQDGYEILSGHNRVNACKLLDQTNIPAEIEEVNDNKAIIIATVTNLQRRQGLLPSERGWAYRALLEAQKRQGARTDLTCAQNEHKLKARDVVAVFFGVDRNKVQREIRLTYLITPLLDAVDAKKLNLMCGVELSYYDEPSQQLFYQQLQESSFKLTVAAMRTMKQTLPPPNFTVADLESVWCAAIRAQPVSHAKHLVFDRKKFEPYLERMRSETEIEELFLQFLREKYG